MEKQQRSPHSPVQGRKYKSRKERPCDACKFITDSVLVFEKKNCNILLTIGQKAGAAKSAVFVNLATMPALYVECNRRSADMTKGLRQEDVDQQRRCLPPVKAK